MSIRRLEENTIKKYMPHIPVVAIIGARQVGKTTLAKSVLSNFSDVIFLDLEKKSDRQIIENTEQFFNLNKGKVICIDEVQIMPDVLAEMRNFVDNNDDTKFIVLGSSSPDLSRGTSESLAGRIFYFDLTAFLWQEIKHKTTMQNYRLLGGMPKSILAKNKDLAFVWFKKLYQDFFRKRFAKLGF
jgi:predicted AAA+ superfamily ATPase